MAHWRRITEQDIARGTVVRMDGEDAAAFNDGVIMAVKGDEITLARPMAYAHEHWDDNCPLVTSEVFNVTRKNMLSMFKVLQYNGSVCLFKT